MNVKFRKKDFDFDCFENSTLNEYIEKFKYFCYLFDLEYSEEDIEKLKDIYAFRKLEINKYVDIERNI